MRSLAILPALAVALAMVDGAASQTKTVQSSASAERIAHLIDQLGSLKHAERVRATKDLEDIGAAALSQLRKAMTRPVAIDEQLAFGARLGVVPRSSLGVIFGLGGRGIPAERVISTGDHRTGRRRRRR